MKQKIEIYCLYFIFSGEWPDTIQTTMRIMQRLLDLHERYHEVHAQWVMEKSCHRER